MNFEEICRVRISTKKLYFLTAIFLIVLTTISGIKKYAPPIKNGLIQISQEVQADFPKDLDITITPEGIKGEADYPIVLKTPDSLQNYLAPNLVVIDPNGQDFMLETQQALILVTNTRLITLSSQGYQEMDIRNIPVTELNKTAIDKLTTNLTELGNKAYLIVGGYFLARGLINILLIWPVYLLLLSFVYNITDRKEGHDIKSHLREVTLVFIPLIIIHTILQILSIRISFIPWFLTTHILLILYVRGRKAKGGKNTVPNVEKL